MAGLTWDNCQTGSDQILAEGLLLLMSQEAVTADQVAGDGAGNYLVSLQDEIVYVGEAKCLADRIQRQFSPRTSTFYKTYLKRSTKPAPIGAFRVRHISTMIGRKELEEVGMATAGCSLNKFRRGKRGAVALATGSARWLEIQQQYETLLADGEATVLSTTFVPWTKAPASGCAGLYVVCPPQRSDILYVGESSDVQERHNCHSGTTYFSALRRHVGTNILGFSLRERNGKAKYFTEDEDQRVTSFINSCRVACITITFGRYELEERLIGKYRPLLNRKDNKAAVEP